MQIRIVKILKTINVHPFLVLLHVGLHGKHNVGTGMVMDLFLGADYYKMLF